jgi:Uma2 family endonuclease
MSASLGDPPLTSETAAMRASGEQRLLLFGVDWQGYLAIGTALADQPALRLTYDHGSLEFMTTSPKHEIYKKHPARFIEIMAEELNHPFATAGNMTFQSEEVAKGLEADDCFWFEHEAAMRSKLTWDSKADPPPDLGLEIEISRSALNRMAIYAALRVPEVWRFDGQSLSVHRLQSDGTYRQETASQIFRGVPVDEMPSFVAMAQSTDLLSVIRAFRQWVQKIAANAGPPCG